MIRASSSNPAAIKAMTPAKRHILAGARNGEAGQSGGEHGRRRRIGPHHQVPGRAEQGEEGHGDEDGIETGDHRHAGDLGVAHDLGDGQGSQGDAGDDLGGYLRTLDRQHPLQHGKAQAPAISLHRKSRVLLLLKGIKR